MNRLVINDLVPSNIHHTKTLQDRLFNEFADKGVVLSFVWKNYPLALHENHHIVVSVERMPHGFSVTVEELFKTHPRAQSVKPVSFAKEIGPSKQTSSGFIIDWIKVQMRFLPPFSEQLKPSPQIDTYDVF